MNLAIAEWGGGAGMESHLLLSNFQMASVDRSFFFLGIIQQGGK